MAIPVLCDNASVMVGHPLLSYSACMKKWITYQVFFKMQKEKADSSTDNIEQVAHV